MAKRYTPRLLTKIAELELENETLKQECERGRAIEKVMREFASEPWEGEAPPHVAKAIEALKVHS